MAQPEAQKTSTKTALPKPGPAPKGIPQPSVLGKAPKEEPSADATIKDYPSQEEEVFESKTESKKEVKPEAKKELRAPTPTAVTALPVAADSSSDAELRLTKEIEARLSREIEAKLRRELEPRIAKELELKLLRQFDNQLQRVVNESVEKAILRHSQPNLQAVSREEINAMRASTAPKSNPTPMMFKALSAPDSKPERLLTPGTIPIAAHPSQPNMVKVPTPAALAIPKPSPSVVSRPSNPAMPRLATPASLEVPKVPTPAALPIQSPAQEMAPAVIHTSASPTTPAVSIPEPVSDPVWEQDPSQQKAKQTQQIRVSKIRVPLDDVSPEKLIGPTSEDLSKDFLKDAGVSKGSRIAVIVLLLSMLLGGSGFGAYYVYSRQTPNPPRVAPVHAAISGVERGTVRFGEQGPDIAVVFQPPTMLLGQGKIKKLPVTTPRPAAAPVTPKATPPPATPPATPKTTAPKLQVVPRNN